VRTSVDVVGVIFATHNVDDHDNGHDKSVVHLDNQAGISVFKDSHLLDNIREAEISVNIGGINSQADTFKAHLVGDFQDISTVYYHPQAAANILAWKDAINSSDVSFDKASNTFILTSPSQYTYAFKPNASGLHTHDFEQSSSSVLIATVRSNEYMYTQREVKAAKQAKEIIQRLGYPSARSAIEMINNGSLINCPVTAQDMLRAYKIYGPDLASLRGKTTFTPSVPHVERQLTRVIIAEQVLHTDIMFVNQHAFLVSVSEPLQMLTATHLGKDMGGRAKAIVRQALAKQIGLYKSRQFTITTLLSDGEGAIASLTSEIEASSIAVNPSGAGQHVPTIERNIRTMKERARGILATIPYELPTTLIPWLVYYVVTRINIVPRRGGLDHLSPREAFLGIKTDFKRDLKCGFGDYLECSVPNQDNSMLARTQSCIALCPIGTQGTIKCMSLVTWQVVTRTQFKVLPMPDNIIEQINKYARSVNGRAVQGLDIAYGQSYEYTNETQHDVSEQGVDTLYKPLTLDVDLNAAKRGEYHSIAEEPPIDADDIIIEERADRTQSIKNTNTNTFTKSAYVPDSEDDDSDDSDFVPEPEPKPKEWELVRDYETRSAPTDTTNILESNSDVYNITIKEALGNTSMHDHAMNAIKMELQQMLDLKVFTPVEANESASLQRPIPSKMFLKEKYDSLGNFDKLKARLVAGGHMQDRDELLYEDITSPTAPTPLTFAVAAIAAAEHRSVVTADVPGAYLLANIKDRKITIILNKQLTDILLQLKPEWSSRRRLDGTILLRLLTALYGTVEAAQRWYNTISDILKSYGYTSNSVAPCIMNKLVNNTQSTVIIYVDDLLFTCINEKIILETIQHIETKLKVKLKTKHGKIHSYLGMTWNFNHVNMCKISMEKYTEDLLKYFNVNTSCSDPAADHLFVIRPDVPKINLDKKELFHTGVAKCLYIAKRTRPDILLPISFLTTRVLAPDEDDWNKLHRVLKYLHKTRELGIGLECDEKMNTHAYIDASYGTHADYKSHSGMIISLGKGPIDVASTKQKINTKSSSEAELVALSDKSSHVLWHRNFLIAQGYDTQASKIYQDNQSTITLASNGTPSSDRSRHVSIRFFWMKDKIKNGEIEIIYKPTDDMIADILTKPLHGRKFIHLRDRLLNWKL
jgi:hypothetical protein